MAISPPTKRLILVYYCSGHGYGHATRVSAFARHLLGLQPSPIIHIVSSAPKHVFSDSIERGALYRNAVIDPVIVQPLAYRVDRRKSVEVLEHFLEQKDAKVADESQWLKAIHADCVLSDAAFLGCLAANEAGIPSVLITNFSFDSVYSYLSTSMIDESSKPIHPAVDAMLSPTSIKAKDELEPDTPIPEEELAPLVAQIHAGYRCADLLLRLPGTIPLPSFAIHPALPSPAWIDDSTNQFKPFVTQHLAQPPSSYTLHPQIPFPPQYAHKPLPREVREAPLLVRPPSADIYTPEGRSRLLTSLGVPEHLHDPAQTKILVVSFGGQIFHKPASRSHSRTPSKAATPTAVPPVFAQSPSGSGTATQSQPAPAPTVSPSGSSSHPTPVASTKDHAQALADALREAAARRAQTDGGSSSGGDVNGARPHPKPPSRTNSLGARFSKLRVAGAPPAAVPASPRSPTASFAAAAAVAASSPSPAPAPTFQAVTIPPTPSIADGGFPVQPPDPAEDEDARILPSDAWIAIVCGVPHDWGGADGGESDGLPARFFVAPRAAYMPDVTAVADVLLGKLGYGTVAECVDAGTPCVYVPRPLFVEEHGLRAFLEREGVGVRMERERYEVGEWAGAVEEAWERGREGKERRRREGARGSVRRGEEGREMARALVEWVGRWQAGAGRADGAEETTGVGEMHTNGAGAAEDEARRVLN